MNSLPWYTRGTSYTCLLVLLVSPVKTHGSRSSIDTCTHFSIRSSPCVHNTFNWFNWFNCTGTILAANQPAKGGGGGGGGGGVGGGSGARASQVVRTRERLLANLFRQMWHAVTVPNLVGVATAGLNGFSRTRDAVNGQQQQQQRQQQQVGQVGGWGGAVGGRRAGQGGPAESVRLLRIPKEKVSRGE